MGGVHTSHQLLSAQLVWAWFFGTYRSSFLERGETTGGILTNKKVLFIMPPLDFSRYGIKTCGLLLGWIIRTNYYKFGGVCPVSLVLWTWGTSSDFLPSLQEKCLVLSHPFMSHQFQKWEHLQHSYMVSAESIVELMESHSILVSP